MNESLKLIQQNCCFRSFYQNFCELPFRKIHAILHSCHDLYSMKLEVPLEPTRGSVPEVLRSATKNDHPLFWSSVACTTVWGNDHRLFSPQSPHERHFSWHARGTCGPRTAPLRKINAEHAGGIKNTSFWRLAPDQDENLDELRWECGGRFDVRAVGSILTSAPEETDA